MGDEMSSKPYLSVVATARNDNHGGQLLQRMQAFVDGLADQARRFQLPIELILVEWNPPSEREGLRAALRWPNVSPWCTYRIIQVPPALHALRENAKAIPLFQMLGKNVGIRRAAAPYILATNIDILFSDTLMKWLTNKPLRPGISYRVERHDVPAEVAELPVNADRMMYCGTNRFQEHRLDGSIDLRTGHYPRMYRYAYAWREQLGRWLEPCAQWLPMNTAIRRWWNRALVEPPMLFTNACGDFTLMSRADWFKVRAYPELECYSLHLDGLYLYLAHYAGIREIRVAHPIYHIDHSGGLKAEDPAELFERLRRRGLSWISDEQLHTWLMHMRRERKPLTFNDADWGYAAHSLAEERFLGDENAWGTTPNLAA